MDTHLSRKELTEAAKSEDLSRFPHLDRCRECREAVSLLRTYDVAGSEHLVNAPDGLVEKAAGIAAGHPQKEGLVTRVARLIFDSWCQPLPVGVRGQALLAERRLRFESEGLVFDLRAEQHTGKWSFVGNIAGPPPRTGDISLKVGNRKQRPNKTGVFQWESSKPPKRIMILLDDLTTITVPELSWKRALPR